MIAFYRYFSAARRLDKLEKAIIMMGGSQFNDDNIPMQLAAQRDMLKGEVEYYEERIKITSLIFACVLIVSLLTIFFLSKIGVL